MAGIIREPAWPKWIKHQLVRRGIHDQRVLSAMAEISRAHFVSLGRRSLAQEDRPIPIGFRQTVSQPYIIALSLQALALTGTERVLDVGTGSGYQAALLSRLAKEVFSIEVRPQLHKKSNAVLHALNVGNVTTRCGDGSLGWPEAAPFDRIVVGSRAPRLPRSLVDQLVNGGRLVVPVGESEGQRLLLVRKDTAGHLSQEVLERVLFVPLLGAEGSGKLAE